MQSFKSERLRAFNFAIFNIYLTVSISRPLIFINFALVAVRLAAEKKNANQMPQFMCVDISMIFVAMIIQNQRIFFPRSAIFSSAYLAYRFSDHLSEYICKIYTK